jgi:rubrerythrin
VSDLQEIVMTKLKPLFTRGICLAGLCGLAIAGVVNADTLSPQTRKNLETAMHGEAFANLKYLAYAEAARAHGDERLAKLFAASANVEANEHFAREADALGLGGSDVANLTDAVAGEHYENSMMYAQFADDAEKVGDRKAASLFRQIAADEGDHYKQYKDALAERKPGAKAKRADESKHGERKDKHKGS